MPLYAFGSNGSGQLGIGHFEDRSSPQLCEFVAKDQVMQPNGLPVKIAAGGNTTYILFDNGDLYRAGRNPISSADQQPSFSEKFQKFTCQKYSTIKLCSAFWDGAVFVNAENEIFVVGSGPAGELGLGKESKYCSEPEKLQGFPPSRLQVVDIASCVSHTVVVLSNGDVWGWGNGRKGQLGQPAEVIWKPRKIEGIEQHVVRVACGREFTFLLGEGSVGKSIIFGSDKWSVKSEAPVGPQSWRDVAASWGSVFLLDENGYITSWGRGDRGQLSSTNLPAVEQLAVGSEHALAKTTAGDVLAWGWGEHGNCGSRTDQAGNVKMGDWNIIPTNQDHSSDSRLSVGAGCATSFIWGS